MTARPLMIQATCSSAGKSFVVAALCRILSQDGLRVAPFKSQNMALNSAVTPQGLEMGRAQAMQAEAAGLLPDVAMNPVLLKPTQDHSSQVVVMGKPLTNMSAREYFAFRKSLLPQTKEAYDTLAAKSDVVIIEGAGSPAEINIRADDIVNMGIAKLVDAPVVIVGDIDRGGVFASLYGTVALLEPDERRYVKGLLINKFRGDKSLLGDGPAILERLCGAPVLGCLPYIQVDLDDEDSLSDRLLRDTPARPDLIDVCVVRLPHISNYTDVAPLERYTQVSVRFCSQTGQMGSPDVVIVPGTKNTLDDAEWMRTCGWYDAIRSLAGHGGLVLGICGGYQILGRSILDEDGVEGQAGRSVEGVGLLPVTTRLTSTKELTRVEGRVEEALPAPLVSLADATFSGYEIHMGHTIFDDNLTDGASSRAFPFCSLELLSSDPEASRAPTQHRQDGCASDSVFGTYAHGLFDNGDLASRFVELLLERRGLEPVVFPKLSYHDYRQRQYDLLALSVRENIDMDLLYRLIEEGV